jgi:hypothetical protein
VHGKQAPFAGNAFQGVQAVIDEFDAGARDEILDRTGDRHFIRMSGRRHSRSNIELRHRGGDAAEPVIVVIIVIDREAGGASDALA